MKYRLVFQRRALSDLEQQFNYVAQHSPETATRWFSQFVKALESLKTFPERYSRAPESDVYGVEIRQLLYGKVCGVRCLRAMVILFVSSVSGTRHAGMRLATNSSASRRCLAA